MANFGSLIPLLILFVFVGAAAFIGYHIYLWSQQMGDRGRNYMEKKHMSFTKEGGLKVGVKELKDEAYADKTQNVLVNVWNNAAFPNYKSNLGWNSSQAPAQGSSRTSSTTQSTRPSESRTTSTASTSAGNLGVPTARGPARRSASPVPGGFE